MLAVTISRVRMLEAGDGDIISCCVTKIIYR